MTLSIEWTTETGTSDGSTNETSTTFHRLVFDAVTREDHSADAEVTSHAVESTSSISDHKRPSARTLNLEAFVTNTPLDAPPESGFAQSSVTSSIRDSVVTFSEEFDRVSDVWDTLERLRAEAIDLTVTTRYRTYVGLQLVSVHVSREDALDAIPVELSFIEIFRANTTRVALAPRPAEPRGAPPAETTAAPEESDEDEDDRSWLQQGVDDLL